MGDWRLCRRCSNLATCVSTEVYTSPLWGPLRTVTSTSSIVCSETASSIRQPMPIVPFNWLLGTATSRSSNDC